MSRLLDRIAIVTGSGQGLGAAIARRLATEGCHVVVSDIVEDNAVQVAADIEANTDRRAFAVKTDVTKESDCEAMVAKAMEAFGRVDILVANAGILKAGDITEFPADAWRLVIDVNLVGYFLAAKAVSKVMVEQKGGAIVQINSKSGKKGSFRNSAYSASKFGGIGLTQSIALDLAPHGVRVNSVCPGNLLDSPLWVNSLYKQYAERLGITEEAVRQRYIDQVPMKRGCTYEDVANVVVFLASDQAGYMTGQAVNVTGGQEMK
jgi:sorbitol-6-phosphate 2-dehydrogenase